MADDIPLRQRTQVHGVRHLLILALSGLGTIYADLATSPTYTLNGIWPASGPMPSNEDVIGGVSAIVWAMTLVPLLKYAVVALQFGTGEGEGGVFALYMGLFPRRRDSSQDRQLTSYSVTDTAHNLDSMLKEDRVGFQWLQRAKVPLLVWAYFGTSLLMSDGVLTPAISIVSAVQGIAIAKPSVSENVVPISIAFLVVLFLVQRFGTHAIGRAFGPVMLVWFLVIGAMGVVNIIAFPGIWRACDPSRAVMYFVRTKNYDAMAGVILALTGSEAMFATLGQYTASSIRLGFGLAYTTLCLTYLGQGARIITGGADILANPFYQSIPGGVGGGLYWLVFVLAILASLIASQTLITATFSLIGQLVGFQSFPVFKMKYTSERYQGQIYFAAINYALFAGAVGVVAGFGTGPALVAAFGFAVASVFVVTTTFLALHIVFVKGLPWIVAILFTAFFLFIDCALWGATFRKVPHGAWFPLGLSIILCSIMCFWSWGKHHEDAFDTANLRSLSRVIVKASSLPSAPSEKPSRAQSVRDQAKTTAVRAVPSLTLNGKETEIGPLEDQEEEEEEEEETDAQDGDRLLLAMDEKLLELPRIQSFAVFHKAPGSGHGVPHSFLEFLHSWPSLPRVVVFLNLQVMGLPYVDVEDRYLLTKTRSIEGFYGVTCRLGFRQTHRLPSFVTELLPRIISLEQALAHVDSTTLRPTNSPKTIAARCDEIRASATNATHVYPENILLARKSGGGRLARVGQWVRRVLVEEVYARLRVIFPDQTPSLNAEDERERVVKVGVVAHI